jgi:hypothetical protein
LFKIARYWRSFDVLLETLRQTIVNIRSFLFLIAIVLYVYVLLGLELFANRAKFTED